MFDLVKVEENIYKIKISQPGRKTDIIEYKEWHWCDVTEIKIWRHNNPNVQSLIKNCKRDITIAQDYIFTISCVS